MHFLLDKGYFMLAYSHYPKQPCVGECYVHGFMQGEVVKEWEDGKLSSDVFYLR